MTHGKFLKDKTFNFFDHINVYMLSFVQISNRIIIGILLTNQSGEFFYNGICETL